MYQKFDKFITKLLNNIVVIILLFVIGFGTTGTFLYNAMDFKYATDEDYKPLYQTQQNILNDFDAVYTFSNTDIDITDSNIIVKIYGDDCYLKTYFDKTRTYKNTEEIDLTDPIWFSVLGIIIISAIGSVVFFLLLMLILVLMDTTFYNITNRKKKKKAKKERDIDN